jgi:hypothetical protein
MDHEWRRNLVPGLSLAIALVVIAAPRHDFSTNYPNLLLSPWRTHRPQRVIVQADDPDQNEVSTDDVDKYVAVYKAMQRNRSLTIDQATASQGLTTRQFRELENRVQRDEAALQKARDELQAAAQSSPAAGEPSVKLHPYAR